ncbi:MAG: hypothetical protein WD097_10595 [Balneolales bacterium]
MLSFSGIILFIISFYAATIFLRLFAKSRRIFHFCLGTTAVFVAIIGISEHLAFFFPILNPEFLFEWSRVFAVSFLLSATAALIRDSKPEITRFPRFFTFIPLLLITVYPLIFETVILKMWVINLYQGSALFISLLIYSYKSHQDTDYGYMLVGVFFFFITFALFNLPDFLMTLPDYVWVLLTASGILIITVGYGRIYQIGKDTIQNNENEQSWFV